MTGKFGKPRPLAFGLAGLLCTATGAWAQVPLADFTTYNAATASTVTPGIFSLYAVPVDSLAPTQFNVGFAEVASKTNAWNLVPASQLQTTLLESVEPVVIGPGGQLYQINGHHSFTSLQDSIYGATDPTVYVNVVANYSSDTPAQFVAAMEAAAQVYPLNDGSVQTINSISGNPLSPLPTTLSGLTNDPYRGVEFQALKNKGAAGVSFDKTSATFSDFVWADAYRNATTANGTGLPFLTPAEVNAVAAWSQVGTNQTTLPGYGTTTVNKLPGYILPTGGSINITSTISNATLANGALDGSVTGTLTAAQASFNGMNGYSIGAVTIQSQIPGFVMQLGANNGSTVTLSGNNTYTGGTNILAGTLIAANDAALGAAPTGGTIDPNNVVSSVQASNGIVFNSLSEGNGTLQFGTTTGGTFTTARNIAIGEETANFDTNGNTVTLTGNIASYGLGEDGLAALTLNDPNTVKGTGVAPGTLILAPASGSNPLFYGNLVISAGTLQVSSDAAMGAVVNPGGASVGGSTTSEIGQIDLDGGTFKAGASFTSVRSMFLTGSSTYDTNGYSTSYSGSLSDTQRTLTVMNSSTTTAGSVAFGSLNIASTATLNPDAGSSPGVSVTLTNGITREGNATLFLAPSSGTLGTTEKVFSSGASTTIANGIVAPWIVIDSGAGASSNPYSFATYGADGYTAAASSGNSIHASSTAGELVVITSNSGSPTGNGTVGALDIEDGKAVTLGAADTLTIGGGAAAAGLIMDGGSATITGGTVAFGASEAVISAKGTNILSSAITGGGGLTLSGSGSLQLNNGSADTGATVINSGTLILNTANALSGNSNVTLEDVKSSPSAAELTLMDSNAFSSLNSAGNNSTVTTGAGIVLTIGDSNDLSSTLSSTITDGGAATGTAGALTKNGTGLLDLSNGSSKAVTLNAASTVVVNGGQLRIGTNTFTNANAFALASGTELQFLQGGTGAFASNITGGGLVHVESGILQLTGTGNTYTGGTTLETGTTLVATTANLSQAANQTITNAGGMLVLDQTTNGNFTAVMSDGVPGLEDGGTPGPSQPGSLVKADSTGSNGGNVTIANAQQYTGATTVEAGTLTLGATNAVATSSGVTLGTVGGGATANLALGANNTVQGLNSVAGNTTGVQLNGNTLTVQQAAGTASSFGGNITDTGAGNLTTTGTGTVALSGGNSIGGNLNVGTGTFSQTGGSLSVGGNVTNNGIMSVNATTAFYDGNFTNNGLLTSDPSTQTFNNLSVTQSGAIQAAVGDLYKVSGNFTNASTQNAIWNTMGASLEFISGTSHTMQLAGSDLGATAAGYQNNFAWRSLTIDAGDSLTLTGAAGSAFYTDDIIGVLLDGDTVTNIDGDGLNIYYDPYDSATSYLDGLTYDLTDGGELIADVPEPTSIALLLTGLTGGIAVRRRKRA